MNKIPEDAILLITKAIKRGQKVFPRNSKKPVAIAENNFKKGDIGVIDGNICYPVEYNNVLLILPGLKIKMEKKCQKHKKKG